MTQKNHQRRGGARLEKNLNHRNALNSKPSSSAAPVQAQKAKKNKRVKIAGILCGVTALIVVLIAVGVNSLFIKPSLPSKEGEAPTVRVPGQSEDELLDYGDGIRPRSDGERKSDNYYTVLILGRDTGGGGNTDTMLLASYDVTNQKATIMSIPRDTMVNVPWDVKRINSVYNWYGGGEKGVQRLYQEISQLVGFEPDFRVVVEWEAIGEIVECIGGVWFDVPRDMDYDDPLQDLSIHLKAGYQRLNGQQAMGVIRFREGKNGYANGDIGRIETQQAFLKAVVEQLLQVSNVSKIGKIAAVFQENVETDLSFQNILWFAQQAIFGGLKTENINFVTMPYEGKYAYSRSLHANQSYVVPLAEELLELVNNDLSPFVEKFTLKDLDIMGVNADGSIYSSTGYVEDTEAFSSSRAVQAIRPGPSAGSGSSGRSSGISASNNSGRPSSTEHSNSPRTSAEPEKSSTPPTALPDLPNEPVDHHTPSPDDEPNQRPETEEPENSPQESDEPSESADPSETEIPQEENPGQPEDEILPPQTSELPAPSEPLEESPQFSAVPENPAEPPAVPEFPVTEPLPENPPAPATDPAAPQPGDAVIGVVPIPE